MRVLLSCLLVPLSVASAAAFDTGYVTLKGGSFLPNGKGGSHSLESFNSGYSAELAVGYRPESYAALELGTGLYSASGTVSTADSTSRQTLYGVPITATAKAILDLEKFELFGGAGIGYYFAFIDNEIDFAQGGFGAVRESSHGSALGYHLTLGGDYKVSDRFRVGADFKYFVAKPELELTDAQNQKSRAKWDVGGTLINLDLKYLF